ncbi:Uncharacterized protein APZ42_033589, partial [Daphnia magna]
MEIDMMDGADGGIMQGSMKYFLVRTVETDEDYKENTFYTCVPTTWISKCKQLMLYPPVGLHCVSGVNIEPPKWRSNVFKRFRFPTPDWLEYDIVHIHNLHKPGSHDRVHKSAAAAMKGSKNFEDILKSDNDVSLGRGARLKIKKNFDIPEANDKPKKKNKTDGTENETSLSINRTMDPFSRKVVPENQNAEIVCASYNAVHADDITIDKEA